MYLAVGLVLLAAILYASVLSYALRGYSRSRLAEHLPDEIEEGWLAWLDRYEGDLQVLSGFVRYTLILAVAVWSCVGVVHDLLPALDYREFLGPGFLTLLLLLFFAVGLPHALALHAGEAFLAQGLRWRVLSALRWVFWPVARILLAIEFVVRRLLGKSDLDRAEQSELAEREILDAVSEGEAQGAVNREQREIIRSVFELPDTAVSAIMTPRTDIVAVQADAFYDEVREVILKSGHSRVPVYEQSLDHILGVLYAKDLLKPQVAEAFDARKTLRAVPYVPATKTVNDLLRELRQSKVHMAIVLDEYGGTAGLVTIEDILEELVGEIADEYDHRAPPLLNLINANLLEADARAHISEVNAQLGAELPDEGDFETVGGFVLALAGRIPAAGEEFAHQNLKFRVLSAEPRRIGRLRIQMVRAG